MCMQTTLLPNKRKNSGLGYKVFKISHSNSKFMPKGLYTLHATTPVCGVDGTQYGMVQSISNDGWQVFDKADDAQRFAAYMNKMSGNYELRLAWRGHGRYRRYRVHKVKYSGLLPTHGTQREGFDDKIPGGWRNKPAAKCFTCRYISIEGRILDGLVDESTGETQ